ncbi:retrovirus-related Pol polyprotein from transposon TNT 1-94 [Trichonephila clavipes]|nr:retrovirus-related Pol polyprotein from transposon TNT 1-94 [Trichonephila clavipes]
MQCKQKVIEFGFLKRKLSKPVMFFFNESVNGEAVLGLNNKSEYTPLITEESESDEYESETEISEGDEIPCENLTWIRKTVPRPDGTRVDIYYGFEGRSLRLRSYPDVEKYCRVHNIKFNKNFLNFSGKDKYSGPVPKGESSTSEYNNHEAHHEVAMPQNFKEASLSPDKDKWFIAMKEEINMSERCAWELVPRPEKEKVIGNRWVYTIKRNEEGKILRYKARLVAQGYRQCKGETYDEVFSPVVNFSIIRMFFTILVCCFGWSHCQFDIKCAYLYANLGERVLMQQPQGFIDHERPHYVCLLNKAIYDLHQSGRECFFEIHTSLEELNFKKLNWCNCAYINEDNVVLLLYVDDIVLFVKSDHHIKEIIRNLKVKFDLKIMGRTKKLLGVEFEEVDGKLFIHQTEYINKVCNLYRKYKFPISTLPLAKGIMLTKIDCPNFEMEITEKWKDYHTGIYLYVYLT